MRIAVTGGTGFVGQALIDWALFKGFEVVALTRRPQEPRQGIEWIEGDLSDAAALSRLAGEAQAVIHVAGMVNAPDAAAFEACNVAGTASVIEASLAARNGRFIFVSSLSAREPALSAYGASKARAERLVMASPLDWTIVRPPAIYGRRDREMLELFRTAKWGFVPVPEGGRASVINVDDLSYLLLNLLSGPRSVIGHTFEPDDGMPGGWANDELARAIGEAVGKRVRVLGLSRRALSRAAWLDHLFRGRRAKLTPDRAAYFSHPDWVVSADARVPEDVWRPQLETRQGLKTTATWYREQGWL